MKESFSFLPVQASVHAGRVDAIYFALIGVTTVFVILIAVAMLYFAIRYRRTSTNQTGVEGHETWVLEVTWSVIPLIIGLGLFGWGAVVFLDVYSDAPKDAMEVAVVGKQWMWKVQHPNGRREINDLHVPAGKPVKLTMVSEDVIHSFYIPALRIKHDVLPGRYTSLWFQADLPGVYHLFCAEYCGTQHSGMIGRVFVLEPTAYVDWLAGTAGEGSPVINGKTLLSTLGCVACHRKGSGQMGPLLEGIYGGKVRLQDGSTVVADDNYLRESILNPNAKIVAGFQPLMPSFQGRVSEEDILQILSYIKASGTSETTQRTRADSGVRGNKP
jgi:cytochrome c oxidase subunit II